MNYLALFLLISPALVVCEDADRVFGRTPEPRSPEPREPSQRQGLACGNYIVNEGDDLEFTSPNFPNNYPSRRKCVWRFKPAVKGMEMVVNCASFDMEPHSSCRRDFLMLNAKGSNKTKYCGTDGPINYVATNKLIAVFKSNRRNNYAGFTCNVRAGGCTTAGTTASTAGTTASTAGTSASTAGTTASTAGTTASSVGTTASGCKCGMPNRATRIVGGVTTEKNEYPWQVGLVNSGNRPWCGGSIINDRWILTAAHCTSGETTSNLKILVQEHDVTDSNDGQLRMAVRRIVDHPSYNRRTLDYDFSLVELATPLTFGSNNLVAPVCLPTGSSSYAGSDGLITGWGRLASGGSSPSKLQEVTVPVLTNSVCQSRYPSEQITSRMICAGTSTGGKDSCQGDSGGPMTTQNGSNRYDLIGVVSWGYGCADRRYPGVYARVTAVSSWISSTTAGANTCS